MDPQEGCNTENGSTTSKTAQESEAEKVFSARDTKKLGWGHKKIQDQDVCAGRESAVQNYCRDTKLVRKHLEG